MPVAALDNYTCRMASYDREEGKMPETIDSIKQKSTKKPEPKEIREALLRLRELAANLPPIDAVAVVRDIREAGSSAN